MTDEQRKAIYQDLCKQGKVTGLFMQPWWLDACGPWGAAIAVRNEQVVGAMPYATGKRWGVSLITMPILTHHLRLWMEKPPDISDHKWLTREKQMIWLLIDDLPDYGFFSMVFEADSFNNWLPFHWKEFKQEMRYTFVIDQVDASTLDQQINRNLKRTLRDNESNLKLTTDIDAGRFYAMCTETYRRQRMKTPFDASTFARLDQAIHEHGAGIKLGITDAYDHLVAVAYLIWDDTRAYYFLAGDNEAGRAMGASITLCREALRIAFEERQLSSFDFCGSMLEPITEIRRQFGARAVPLMKIFRAKYRWLDVLYSLRR